MKKTKTLKRKRLSLSNPGRGGLLTAIQAGSLLLLMTLIGCANSRPVVLHVIDKTDIVLVKEGEDFKAPKDGAFLSDFYIQKVMRARVDQ